MVGIRWEEEVTFSFSPLNRLGFQAQEVRAGGDGNTGAEGWLAMLCLQQPRPGGCKCWREGKVRGGSLQCSPHRPHPAHTLSCGLTSPLEMMPPWAHWLPPEPSGSMGKSSCVHLPCTLAKGSLAHSWAGGLAWQPSSSSQTSPLALPCRSILRSSV